MDQDTQTGFEAFRDFHNASAMYSAYGKSYDELLAVYGKKAPIYAEGIGLAIRLNEMSPSSVRKSMEGLADVAKGRVPKDHQEYIKFLQNQASQINWFDLTTTVAKETLTQTTDGLVTFGNSVTKTLSWFTTLLPFLAIGGVIFYIYSFSKNNSTVSKDDFDKIKKGIQGVVKKVKKTVAKNA